MPISSSAASVEKKKAFRIRGKTATASVDIPDKDTTHKHFLTIGPALPSPVVSEPQRRVLKRSLSTLSSSSSCVHFEDGVPTDVPVTIQNSPDGSIHASRTQKAKEKNPDRICLDRRGLSLVPIIDGEPRLRLLSLQHNLISNLDGFQQQGFPYLVFLDVYDNQLEKIYNLDTVENLRVLLMGKNRIKRIDGLQRLVKLEVLDLHGNQITQVSGLTKLSELKVLNLAGNQIRIIGLSDLRGLQCLQELNLRRNRIKKLLGFGDVPQLQKLFVSNNEIQSVGCMSSVAKCMNMREVAIDNNPVSLGGECVSFLVSYLPQLTLLSGMQVTDQVRKAAMAWRRNKENSNAAFMDLTSDVCLNVYREEIISNARTNWELLRSQTKCITAKSNVLCKDLKMDSDFVLTPISKPEIKPAPCRSKDKRSTLPSSKISVLPDKKLNMIRTSSQDTENSQNTSSSNTSTSNEFFRLPPILVPIINKLEKDSMGAAKENEGAMKRWGSLSSIGPNVDSSSFPTSSAESNTSSGESDCEKDAPCCVAPSATAEKPDGGGAETRSTITTVSAISIPSSSTSGSDLSNNVSIASKASSKRSVKSAISQRCSAKLLARANTAKVKQKNESPPNQNNKDREQGGDYLIEICGRYLNVYGQGALRFIDRPWNSSKANDVNIVKFSYVNYNSIISVFSKLKNRFPNVDTLMFCETNIYCSGQLNALAEVQGFSNLQITEDGNPIYRKSWRSYSIYRLSHWGLKVINSEEITEDEIKLANEEFQSLSDIVLWSLPDILLQPLLVRLQLDINNANSAQSAKKWLLTADPALRSVVSKEALQWHRTSITQDDVAWRQKARMFIGSLLQSVCSTVDKLRLLEDEWPVILNGILKEILLDYSQLDDYMKTKLQELK